MNLFLLFITFTSAFLFKITNNLIYTIPLIGMIVILVCRRKYYLILGYVALFLTIVLIPVHQPVILEREIDNYVIEVTSKEKSYYIVKDHNHTNYLIYLDEDITSGSKLKVNGSITRLKNSTVPLVFNFASYLKSKNVSGQIIVKNYEVIYESVSFKDRLINSLLERISPKSAGFIRLLIFGEKTVLTESIYDSLVGISAVHLFVVSGFHFNSIKSIIRKILKPLINNQRMIDGLILIVLLFYLYLLDFSVSATRSYIFILLNYLNILLLDKHFQRLELLSLTGILMILLNPYIVITSSFSLCFVVSFVIEFVRNLNSIPFNKIVNPFILHLSTLPLTLNFNYQYNLISLVATPLLTLPTMIFFYFSILVILFPFLDYFYLRCLIGFESFINFIYNIPLTIILGKLDVIFMFIYYSLLFICLLLFSLNMRKKALINLALIIPLIVLQYFSSYFIITDEVHFIDVGQGDCILIRRAFNQGNILIDTGGNKSFDLAKNRLIPYFKALNIKKIDTLIISHEDFDHNGAMESLISNYKIENIYIGNTFDSVNVGGLVLNNLNYGNYCESDNECSNVIFTNIGGIRFLFTGDITISIERDIISQYEDLECDILKVSHHGSKTSTSKDFLKVVNPKVAVIQSGVNYYGHPHQEVLDRLNEHEVRIFNTRYDGTVIIKIFSQKVAISLTPP